MANEHGHSSHHPPQHTEMKSDGPFVGQELLNALDDQQQQHSSETPAPALAENKKTKSNEPFVGQELMDALDIQQQQPTNPQTQPLPQATQGHSYPSSTAFPSDSSYQAGPPTGASPWTPWQWLQAYNSGATFAPYQFSYGLGTTQQNYPLLPYFNVFAQPLGMHQTVPYVGQPGLNAEASTFVPSSKTKTKATPKRTNDTHLRSSRFGGNNQAAQGSQVAKNGQIIEDANSIGLAYRPANTKTIADSTKTSARYRRQHKDPKIPLPAPAPTAEYKRRVGLPLRINQSPQPLLLVLDLNGTLIYRPNRKRSETFIARPFLAKFLGYIFDNFSVMVWSSSRPENVRKIVSGALNEEQQSKLVALWGRDKFGLSEKHYNMNVQVYKELTRIWNDGNIQQTHPDHMDGGEWGQHNTVLIDDSILKASSEPHNLIQIPEFEGTTQQMNGDILSEVAGYLKELSMHSEASAFVKQHPFKADGTWKMDWPESTANRGEMITSK